MKKILTLLEVALIVVAFALGRAFAVSDRKIPARKISVGKLSVSASPRVMTVSKYVAISLKAGDKLVCGVNPSSYSGAKTLIEYTVDSGHSVVGNLALSGRQN